jgi:predicted signal transduction protein with EAL and GGDEF domain
MPTDTYIDTQVQPLADVVVLVRRDGMLLEHIAGREVFALNPEQDGIGRRLDSIWPKSLAALIKQLVRRAIADRSTAEGDFRDHGRAFQARATAQGPDRAICVIRPNPEMQAEALLQGAGPAPQLDRRGFLRRFRQSIASAALSEKRTAVAIILIDGIADIARIIDTKVSEQVIGAALQRLPLTPADAAAAEPPWYMGQLSEGMLALVLETADRDAIDACVARVCQSLCMPISIRDATFHLTPHAGVAVLGQDAASPKVLLDHARAAASEARRSGAARVCFFSDTLKLRSLARLDIARELREAIATGAIHLRYVSRHDLASGRLVARVGYLCWIHPLRGEVRPAEFVSVAEATGLAKSLSRRVLACLRKDFAMLAQQDDSQVRISFGALRHHILQDDFVGDIKLLIAEGAIAADRLELRMSERSFIAAKPSVFDSLSAMGIHLVIEDVGRGMSSLERMARAPLWGLQLDGSWTDALRHDAVAFKVCRAALDVAAALGLMPIATGVDDHGQRLALLDLGCQHGMGSLYGDAAPDSKALKVAGSV